LEKFTASQARARASAVCPPGRVSFSCRPFVRVPDTMPEATRNGERKDGVGS